MLLSNSVMRCGPSVVCCLLWTMLLTAGWPRWGWAQATITPSDIHFERVVLETGPSHNTINTITQDQQGFLWIGTLDGLNRYDGYEITVYRHDPADTTSLVDSNVWEILEDRTGRLWIGTNSGIDRFDRKQKQFVHYRLTAGTSDRDLPYIIALYEDRAGMIWVGTSQGVFSYDPAHDRFVLQGAAGEGTYRLTTSEIYGVAEDSAGALWVLTKSTYPQAFLHRLDRQTEQVWVQEITAGALAPGKSLLLIDPVDAIWIGAQRLGHFDEVTQQFDTAPEYLDISSGIWSITATRDGALWIGSLRGTYRYDPDTATLTHHSVEPASPALLQEEVTNIFEDRAGVLWVGTFAGLYRHDQQAKPFVYRQHDASDANSLSGNIVMALQEDGEGTLWVGTYGGGLNQINTLTGRVHRFDGSLPGHEVILCLASDAAGTLWVPRPDGLYNYDPKTGRVTRQVYSTEIASIWAIQRDGQNRFWLGTTEGVYRHDPATGTTRRYLPPDTAKTATGKSEPVYVESDSVVWTGTETGILYRIDVVDEQVTGYPLVTNTGRRLQAVIWAIHQHADGSIWLGTSTGLSRFDGSTETFTHYFEQDGLPGSVVYSMLEDDDGRLWLGTNQGLVRFDQRLPVGQQFRTYTAQDGTGNTEFNRRAAYKSTRGEFFFGGIDGLTSFFPEAIQDNAYRPPVALTHIEVANRDSTTAINPFGLDHLVLSHRDYTFSVEFAALSYTNPQRNQYAYMLEGFDETWVPAGTRRYASYTNIPPGDYVFRVKGSNNDGMWNEAGVAIGLTITPPWWGTWWFRLLLLLGVIGGLAMAYRYRVRRLLEREEVRRLAEAKRHSDEEARRLAELDAAKSHFFANISHEFRTPLTLILGAADQLDETQAGPVRRNARRLLHLIDQLLDLSKLEAGKLTLDPQPGDLVAHLREQVQRFAPLAERKHIALHLRTDLASLPCRFDADKMATLLSNLLSNALKFTPDGGKVLLTLARRTEPAPQEEVWVEIVVKDTGSGIPRADLPRIFDRFERVNGTPSEASGTGIGLALAKDLAELHGGTILVESEEGFGSAFIVHLPVEEADEDEIAGREERRGRSIADGLFSMDEENEEPESKNQEPETARRTPHAALRTPTILIVEDNAEVRGLLRGIFGAHYRVLEAADGEAGLAQAQAHQPDLVLSDVMMPKMNGVALCRALKADAALRTIPVLLLTAKAAESDAVEGLEAGADAYVAKPFGTEVLRAHVASLLAARQQMRARFSQEVVVKPTNVVVDSEEEAFLKDVLAIVEDALPDSTFSVDHLAERIGISRRQLERRLKDTTGQTPAELIRQMRLERASQLLQARAGSVSEIAYAVGYKSASYFSTAFREAFGHSPSEHFDTAS
ncbi:MAG TPA: two-component regulator propeller domain-containing protein [Rhodothermales bacterium]|nr:two-component regulator propeller domain-containing protein [Rhodothermales bacterium]